MQWSSATSTGHLADYVLIWSGDNGDDIAKSPHMARIATSIYDDVCPGDPLCTKCPETNGWEPRLFSVFFSVLWFKMNGVRLASHLLHSFAFLWNGNFSLCLDNDTSFRSPDSPFSSRFYMNRKTREPSEMMKVSLLWKLYSHDRIDEETSGPSTVWGGLHLAAWNLGKSKRFMRRSMFQAILFRKIIIKMYNDDRYINAGSKIMYDRVSLTLPWYFLMSTPYLYQWMKVKSRRNPMSPPFRCNLLPTDAHQDMCAFSKSWTSRRWADHFSQQQSESSWGWVTW